MATNLLPSCDVMIETTAIIDGVFLNSLNPGSVVEVVTKNRQYRVEYLGANRARISGHPQLCLTPLASFLHGSANRAGTLESGFIGRGMRLVFQGLEDAVPVTTSEILDVRVV